MTSIEGFIPPTNGICCNQPNMGPNKYPRCNCCPYGYHIDLDFINYCKSLGKIQPSDGQRIRRDRRRQRHSMEIMLGFEPIFKEIDSFEMLPKVGEVSPEIVTDYRVNELENGNHYYHKSLNEKRLASAFANNALADVVQDFEKTLERTRKKSSSVDDTVDTISSTEYRKRKEVVTTEYEMHVKVENGFSPAKEMDLESVKSSSSNTSELSLGALQYIREQMASSLGKIRDLEEQNKIIPVLQKQLASLKEEKRSLEGQLLNQKSKSSSPFTTLRISPVNLRSNSFSEIIRPKPTMREIGVMCTAINRDNYSNTSPTNHCSIGISTNVTVSNLNHKLYTEEECQKLIELELRGNAKQTRSVGSQMVEVLTRDVANQTLSEPTISTNQQGSQTEIKRSDKGLTARPETKSIGSSDHSIKDLICDKCKVKKRTVGCGPDDLDYVPISLKQLENLNSSKTEDKIKDVMTSSQSSIGTQMGSTTRDAGTQSTMVSLSNKFSQSDLVVVKSKPTDTFDLLDFKHQSTNTPPPAPAETPKTLRNSSTNTIKTNLNDSGTNTIPSTTQESAVNTESVSKKDASSGDSVKSHLTVTCDINFCDSCKKAVRELAKDIQVPPQTVPKSPNGSSHLEASKIPRPSMMSPLQQRKVFKRQDTYTVEDKMTPEKNLEDDKKLSALKCPLDALYGTQLLKEDVQVKSVEVQSTTTTASASEQMVATKEEQPEQRMADPIIKDESPPETKSQGISPSSSKVIDEEVEDEEPSVPEPISIESQLKLDVKNLPKMPRKTARPTREMMGALKVINDSLLKSMDGHSLLNANTIVRKEWFKISSTESADPLDVEDYLDCFEEFSGHLLRYMVNLTDANGNTAMHYAVSHGSFDIVSILLDSKVCNVNQINNAGYTCVMLVSLVKLSEPIQRQVVQRLFQMSDVNIKAKKHNQTALMLAVSHGNLEMVSILLESGADVNTVDEDGSTALMCAAEHGKIDIVKLLLAQADCDSSIQDVDGSTALKIALDAGYRDIGILLYAHDHMSRQVVHRSPHSTLPRKSKLTATMARFSPSASAPSSPAPSKKYFDQRK